MRGQLGRNKNMVQAGFIGSTGRGMTEGEVGFGGTNQGAVKKGGDGGSEIEPTVRTGQRRGPVARRDRAAVPVTGDEREPQRVKSGSGDGGKESKTFHPLARGVHVGNRKSAATNRHLGTKQTVVMRQCV